MGFCLVNNVAVAARYAQAELGLERIAILDWDVHHGNGTEAIFWDDPSVLYVSLHAWPYYPGTGGPRSESTQNAPGDESETTLNIPLPIGTGDRVYMQMFENFAYPAVAAFAPDAVLVSVGFDAHRDDPLSPTMLTDPAFRQLASRAAGLAPKVAAVFEGLHHGADRDRSGHVPQPHDLRFGEPSVRHRTRSCGISLDDACGESGVTTLLRRTR
jgi:acetoin utilization deacetylase AcuC-like enzyme